MCTYHLESFYLFKTICGIEFESKTLGINNFKAVYWVRDLGWFINSEEDDYSIDIEDKEFCTTCLLLYGRDPELLLK